MRVRIYVMLLLFLPLLSFGQQRWETIISDTSIDYSKLSICKTYDYGLLINAKINSNNNILFKTDVNGNIIWKKNILINNNFFVNRISQNNNGKTVFCGVNNYNAFMFSMNECFEAVWCNELINPLLFSESQYVDAQFVTDSTIIGVVSVYNDDNGYDISLINFNINGELLSYISFNLLQEYSLLDYSMPLFIDKIVNGWIISGYCYYAYPDNPDLVWLKPMFIKIDSSFNKEWFLPYGMNDTIVGMAKGVNSLDSINIQGYGFYYPYNNSNTLNSLLMNFETDGTEKTHIGISNNQIGNNIQNNFIIRLILKSDLNYIVAATYGEDDLTNPMGEFIMDTVGNIFQKQQHVNTTGSNLCPLVMLDNNQFQFVYQYNYSDIFLYKLNTDLSQAEIDTTTYVYDSLCNHPIVSDTIYLDDCDIITAVPEFPTPAAYYAARQKVELTAYPNPVSGNTVYFKLKYTRYHSNMQLTVYDISGRPMAKRPIATGQKEAKLSVNGFSPGLYVAVVTNGKKVLGKRAFVVERSK